MTTKNEKLTLYLKNPTLKKFCNLDTDTRNFLKTSSLYYIKNTKNGDTKLADKILSHYKDGCLKDVSEIPELADIIYSYLDDESKMKLIRANPKKKYNFFLEKQYDPKKTKGIPLEYFSNIITKEKKIINKLHNNVKTLNLGWGYKGPLPKKLPDSLTSLSLSPQYKHPLINLPSGLKTLILGDNYNHPIDNLPIGLQTLKLGSNFNQPLDNLPSGLQTLEFGSYYGLPIYVLPEGLRSLCLSIEYEYKLPKLPSGLINLKINGYYDNPLPTLPKGLKTLHLGYGYEYDLPKKIPKDLKISRD